jgi:hypothetical protein
VGIGENEGRGGQRGGREGKVKTRMYKGKGRAENQREERLATGECTEDTRGKRERGQRGSAAHSAQQKRVFFSSSFNIFLIFPLKPKKIFCSKYFLPTRYSSLKSLENMLSQKVDRTPTRGPSYTRHIVPVT